ncbi:ABC transporter substrate-binding protein [Roseiconus nitratireducens]|uniref:ABC transporter substrate-binding protein n=1 Tax=Roseiconus nitratireducens TaxID=2605748 RepID=A0A5M6D8J8_9BACT|nr:ABC transporter substrate-binding protein [Roseiconus nitratireducens]KAA5543673.1 ABC transporter substrate-binding protein [Roseiconus nitratireducens]
MHRFFPTVVLSVLAAGLPLCAGCRSQRSPDPGDETSRPVAVQLNWYPETEHGGLYQALADGTYAAAGLAMDLRPGGRATPIGPELELQRCQFAIANADDVVIFRQQGIDVVAVMAAMQNHPRCILAREDSGVQGFDDLAGKTFQRQAGRAFVEFLRAGGYLKDVKEVPYHGSIASLVADPQIVIQAYSCAEPLLAQQQGIKVRTLMLSDLGFNPYSSVLVTTGRLIRDDPELVQSVVDATRQGWRNYLTDGQAGNDAILKANEHGMTKEALDFGAKVMKDLAMPDGDDLESVGTMSPQRWDTLHEQLVQLELVQPDQVAAEDCYTLQFLNAASTPAASDASAAP